MYEIRDPIHQTIEFSDREKKIISHPVVQRLRYIRQLGLSFLVYPGANHDRFSHALGVMRIASRVWDRIWETSGNVLRPHFTQNDALFIRQLLRLAGLLHDVGHAPFSHVSEYFMPLLGELELPRQWFTRFNPKRRASHEDYSVLLISSLTHGKQAPLTKDEAQDIASLIHHDVLPSARFKKRFGKASLSLHRFLHMLISGEIDADRMDYLLRDAHHTGVAYGYYDIDHIIQNLGVIYKPKVGFLLTIDATAVRAFEDFLLARYHMFLQVYLHKTTLCFDHFLRQAIFDGEVALVIPGKAADYLELRDSAIVERIFQAAANKKNYWSSKLIQREPAKLILSVSGISAERRLLPRLRALFKKHNIAFFTITSRQYLSKTTPLSHRERALRAPTLLVRRKFLEKIIYEPIERYSSLLKKYNEVINITNLHVLREQYGRATRLLRRFKV